MYINKKISPYNHYNGGNDIKYIVIHSTGNKGDTAKNNVDYFYRADRKSSAHYFIDDNEVWQSVEDYNGAWHVGDGHGKYGISNRNSIGIEMCGTDSGNISQATINKTIELTKYLMNKYNVPIDRVVRHYDASRKSCPYQFESNKWSRWWDFKKRLSGDTLSSNSLNKRMAICTGNGVRVRSSVDTSNLNNVLGKLNKNDTVKIFKRVGDWYEIYYGQHGGYVSAKYISLI